MNNIMEKLIAELSLCDAQAIGIGITPIPKEDFATISVPSDARRIDDGPQSVAGNDAKPHVAAFDFQLMVFEPLYKMTVEDLRDDVMRAIDSCRLNAEDNDLRVETFEDEGRRYAAVIKQLDASAWLCIAIYDGDSERLESAKQMAVNCVENVERL